MADSPDTSDCEENNDVLTKVISTLEDLKACAQGVLGILGEEENDKYLEYALKCCEDLELSPDEENDEPEMSIADKILLEAKQMDKEEKRKKSAEKRQARKEEIDKAEREAVEQGRMLKISRREFSSFIGIVIRHLDSKASRDNFRAVVMKSWDNVCKMMRKRGIELENKCAVDALKRLDDILGHCARVFFVSKLGLDDLSMRDHLNILCLYFKETPEEGAEGAPLKIVSKSLIRTTQSILRKNDPSWKPNKYLIRAAGV